MRNLPRALLATATISTSDPALVPFLTPMVCTVVRKTGGIPFCLEVILVD